jgi:hypothetical protein
MTSACVLGSAVRKNTFSSKLDVTASHTTPSEMSPTPMMLNLLHPAPQDARLRAPARRAARAGGGTARLSRTLRETGAEEHLTALAPLAGSA